jgi:hypothetical protein
MLICEWYKPAHLERLLKGRSRALKGLCSLEKSDSPDNLVASSLLNCALAPICKSSHNHSYWVHLQDAS